jgi:hypothetical protein
VDDRLQIFTQTLRVAIHLPEVVEVLLDVERSCESASLHADALADYLAYNRKNIRLRPTFQTPWIACVRDSSCLSPVRCPRAI